MSTVEILDHVLKSVLSLSSPVAGFIISVLPMVMAPQFSGSVTLSDAILIMAPIAYIHTVAVAVCPIYSHNYISGLIVFCIAFFSMNFSSELSTYTLFQMSSVHIFIYGVIPMQPQHLRVQVNWVALKAAFSFWLIVLAISYRSGEYCVKHNQPLIRPLSAKRVTFF